MEDWFKFRFALFAIILVIVATVQSCNEARYSLFGETVQASSYTTRAYTTHSRRGGTRTRLEVSYQFDDHGTVRRESDTVDLDYAIPTTLSVQFIPKSEDSRIEGHHQRWWLIVFGLAMAVLTWQVVKFWKFYKS